VYSDISLNDYVAPAGRSTFDATAERCLAEPAALLSVLESLGTNMSVFSTDLASGPLSKRFEENIPDGPIEAPLLLSQGGADQLVLPAVQDQYVATRCANGYDVDYRTYEGRDHVPLVEPDSPAIPELIQWTRDRFAGLPATSNCEGR
jgi:alpha-beta hydrolase superfamily lysophospholipase